ncbi:DNA ligase 1-like protein [Drosera capensis]
MSNARAAKKPKSQPPKPPTSNPQNPSSDFLKSTVSDHDNGADSKQLKPNKKKIDGSVSFDSGSKKSPRMRKSPEPEPGNPSMDSPKLSIKELIVKKDGGGDGSSKSESKKSPTKRKSPEPNPISGSPKKGKAFDLVANESGRLAITDIVCNLLSTVLEVTPSDLLPVVYLLANKIAPTHKGLELGIGDASIIKALAVACGRKEEYIKTQFKVDSVNLTWGPGTCRYS